jgi:hypothetical protein
MLRNNKDIMSFKDIKLSSLEIKILKSPSSKREAESNQSSDINNSKTDKTPEFIRRSYDISPRLNKTMSMPKQAD